MSQFGKLHDVTNSIQALEADVRSCSSDVHNAMMILRDVETSPCIWNDSVPTDEQKMVAQTLEILGHLKQKLDALAN